MKYYNYHKHDMYGNIKSLDVIVRPEDYCKRAVELGQDTVFSTNHGIQGNLFEFNTLCKEYNLKLIEGAECYYVPNRKEKDKSNRHIILIAINNEGAKELNNIISISNIDGVYYKPRIDDELLFSLNPKNFIITTACIAGLWNDEKLILKLFNYFKENFYLEVQNHNVESQKIANKKILDMHYKYNIPIIHANDSHYILPEDAEKRNKFLKGKGILYEEENSFILDYPDSDTILKRYKIQGVLNEQEALEALNNTLIFENAENYSLINDDIKLPSLSKNPDLELKQILLNSWNIEKNNIPKEKHQEYIDAIKFELNIIKETHMADYFLMDYKICKLAQEKYNGMLTKTGRGSAPSFYINKLLGLTDIDRIQSPIKLFPTRFMSTERILKARSLPDIDLNASDPEPFIKATKELLGEKNCAWMISWKPLQTSSAFRLYCKAEGLNINEYNDIAINLAELDDYKKSPYMKEEKWKKLIEESRDFVGVIEGVSESPCSMCLYYEDLQKEIGLVKTPKGNICCLLDGYNCDKYKYLKNDYLTVQVWAIIRETFKLINKPIPTISEFNELLDNKTFEIYEKGLTSTINQADSDYATSLIKKYAPKSLSEMSSFVAIIRPRMC